VTGLLLPEFAYAVACCRWRRTPEQESWLRAQAVALDWPLFERIARRHRVEGLVWRALRQAEVAVPSDAAAALQAAADRIARHNLATAAECARLQTRFNEAGVDLLFVKGLTLATLAYGSILPKSGWDIDILVSPADVARAAGLLAEDGYELVTPKGPASPKRIARWHARAKESVWSQPARGSHVELHTGLADNPMLLPGVGMGSPRQEVAISGEVTLPTLRLEELIAYLMVHGASSAWFRLKWLADLAALLEGRPAEEIDALYRRALELGAGRAADLALLLRDRLFEAPLTAALRTQIESNPANRRLLRAALASLTGRSVATELHALRLGTMWIHLVQFGLLPGLRYKLTELRRQVRALAPR